MKYQQILKQVQLSVDRVVQSEIDSVCRKVLLSHVEPLVEGANMNYIVRHGTKQAIFKLKSRKQTFGDIKGNIAEYFGLPKSIIFLENIKGEILLSKQKVLDELFPL